jgi:hypothetical protein
MAISFVAEGNRQSKMLNIIFKICMANSQSTSSNFQLRLAGEDAVQAIVFRHVSPSYAPVLNLKHRVHQAQQTSENNQPY